MNINERTLRDVPSGGPAMLELSTRPWLYALSQQYGTNISRLQDVPDQELQAIANQNIDILWMMGVWELGEYGLNYDRTNPGLLQYYPTVLPGYTTDDIIGSPYAVVNYTCNPELGTDSDLLAFRKKLNTMGLKLMLDFVPNHSAVDCPFVNSTPQYYILSPKGTQPPYNPNIYLPNGVAYGSSCSGCGSWQDTAQFNYWNEDLRQVRQNELLHVASLADAIRCDMAFLLLNDQIQQNWGTQLSSWGYSRPPTEWWSDAISFVKQTYPNVIFLAEVYDPYQPTLQGLGFDYTYDKTLYDKLGNGDLDDVRNWLSSNSVSFLSHSAHFIANHDEPRAAAFFGSWWRADAAALLSYTVPGMKFMWQWDNEGFSNRLDIHLRRELAESPVSDVQSLYKIMIPIITEDVFKYGNWTYLDVTGSDSSWRLIGYRWQYQNEKRLCVINFSDTQGEGSVIVSNAEPIDGNNTIPVTDLLSGTTYYRSASQMQTNGLYVIINSWWAQIFKY